MVLYRYGSTGVVQLLSKASELLGLVPVFPVRNINTFSSGTTGSGAVFRDCVLVKKYEYNVFRCPFISSRQTISHVGLWNYISAKIRVLRELTFTLETLL